MTIALRQHDRVATRVRARAYDVENSLIRP